MDIAKKLREVVTANFIEIVRSEEDRGAKETPQPTAFQAIETKPSADTEAEVLARRELDDIAAILNIPIEVEPAQKPEEDEANDAEAIPEEFAAIEVADQVTDQVADPTEESLAEEIETLESAFPTLETTSLEAITPEVAEEPAESAETDAVEIIEAVTEPVEAVIEKPEETLVAEPVAEMVAEPVVAEAEPVEPEAVEELVATPRTELQEIVQEIEAAYDPLEFVGRDGNVDFARLLKQANLPAVAFTAEQARKLITALPEELPIKVKRMTVQATLEAVNPNAKVDPKEVVADAVLKRVHIGQLRDNLTEALATGIQQRQDEMSHLQGEMERLLNEMRSRISTLETEIGREQSRKQHAETLCDERIGHLEQVILFFQTDENILAASNAPATEEDDVPPFMRDESVYRLLGMNSGDGASEDGKEGSRNGEASPDSPPRRTRR